MPKKDPIVTKKDVIIFFGIFVVMMLGFILFALFSARKQLFPQNIKTEAVKNLKEELKEEKIITDMKCYYRRPGFNLDFEVEKDFEEKNIYEILEKVNKYIDKEDMAYLGEKYAGNHFLYATITIYKENTENKKTIYSIVSYHKDYFNDSTEKESYKKWKIEKYNTEDYKSEYIDEVNFSDKE